MRGLLNYFCDNDDFHSLATGLSEGLREQLVSGLSGSARTLLMACLYRSEERSQLVVTHNLFQAQKLYEDLTALIGEDFVHLYPVNELTSAEIAIASPELKSQRIDVLNHLSEDAKGIIITPIAGLRRMIPPPHVWRESHVNFRRGTDIDLDEVKNLLIAMGYERAEMITSPGEFSIRGGIMDVFPLTETNPIRIELFDTEVDSIRYFDVETQRSEQQLKEIRVGPAEEIVLFPEHFEKAVSNIELSLSRSLRKIKDKGVKEKLAEHIGYEIEQLKQKQTFQGMYKYISYYYVQPASLLDYLPDSAMVIMDEISRIQETSSHLEKEEAEWQTTLLNQGEILTGMTLSHQYDEIANKPGIKFLYLSLFLRHVPHTNPQNIINMSCKAMQNFHGQMNVLQSELQRWRKSKDAVVFLAANKERAKRLERVMEDYKIDASLVEAETPLTPGKNHIMIGDLNGGFELPLRKLVVLTEEEIFTKKASRKPRRTQKMSNAERIKSYSELKVGDYVVHINHGIGKYLGIETLEINGVHKDYLHLRYAGDDKLYVPVEQIDQVQKYVGSEAKDPKVYKLGGSEWKKVKSKVQSSVQDIADDLIKLYAEREATKGYAFSKDGALQQEFESVFTYQETEDQLRAINEIKEDMEKERPMDRLLCGDVGYGKTEVAIRAAFKAINDGKQVAFLVPTTILAQQHFETLQERFAEFPVTIKSLSRFRTRKEQTETTKGLKQGTVDIVIGTHRLLSKDIQFKELGLLIIDEEQRFGVTHKEKIKQMKTTVDVLTLTATPIPRTLHMSMLGVRDLSVIETPPENRFPVQTYVVEYSGSMIREAIERELSRGGQVYFLYNKVETIQKMTEQISQLVPDARVAYAHGQMRENELETVMIDFLDGNYDVLVSTTIIETGVDIPNVNTLIVHDADKMGLSQLYQLRGRVGRSNRVAYSYFMYQRDKVLTEIAEKRLQAIKEFTELGSGFKIAMRDLSIRGAGNLLGAQQHGFIDSVGFDLYSQMLKDAIEERKGEKPKKKEINLEFDLNVDAYIPASYINDEKQKIDIYKRFKGLESFDDVIDLNDEMMDRFGEYPEQVANLLAVARIKLYAEQEKIEKIEQNKTNEVHILISKEMTQQLDGSKLFDIVNKIGRHVNLGMVQDQIKVIINHKRLSDDQLLGVIEEVLQQFPKANKETVQA
ncbi:transcription-repair coupling factor [Pseudalkalibacillus salsuginis]|uniref:transcription-repair coupling factor n=1 Tax=Pseudalkalibacillus salsuginis TaxID=2910972 RepID=UPI001F27DFFB|nr:transcription-repair coupling factor [Pseudalkalibacillus salsuginis]MCF6411918.1 transcription-repair coupling factor [Pseudalkalibacillus salsuginis]